MRTAADGTHPDVAVWRNRRGRETHTITIAAAVVCAPVAVGAVVPAIDRAISLVVALALAAVGVAALTRWGARRVAWWLEDRADAREAARWRAAEARGEVRHEAVSGRRW